MKVVLTGGGSGGHITPLLAVAHKLKQLDPKTEIIYIGERGSRFTSMTADQAVFDKQYQIYAGKFRRYYSLSRWARLIKIRTHLLNLRDFFYVLFGTVQSWFLLRKLQPDVILLKGGFVGVPVGLASRGHYPIVTHDSDTLPGLANRIAGRWATYHATGMPAHFYQYSPDKIKYVGVIVGEAYVPVTTALQQQYREQLKIPAEAEVLMITGGSLGAQSINEAVVSFLPKLLEERPKLHVVHQVGQGHEDVYGDYRSDRLQVSGLLSDMYKYSGAADVIITRAGANTMAEFGVQKKACVVVPNPYLTGGHQLKNAEHMAQEEAIMVVTEADLKKAPETLQTAVVNLLENPDLRQKLGQKLHQLAKPDAAQDLAKLLLEVSQRAGE